MYGKPTYEELEKQVQALKEAQAVLKKTEAALRDSEERYRSLIHKVQTAIVLYDGQGRILTGNPLAQELLGLSEEQLLGTSLIDPKWHLVRTDGSVLPVAEYPARLLLSTRRPLRGYVMGISRPNRDDVVWVQVNAEPECDAAGEIALVIVSFVDITERKLAEEALRRLNRELKAINNFNQVLLRAMDEQTLLKGICRIICDNAGYRMAWVGYAGHDETGAIRPVAWAGAEAERLSKAGITRADSEPGRGAAGRAIREGIRVCVQDFAADPHAGPLRESALQHGYRSSIAIPLKNEGGIPFGALCIYSTEPNAFTPDETRLLERLAGDLSFGIATLRIQAEHKKSAMKILASEQLFRALVENSPNFIARYDREFRRIYVNPAIQKLFGGQAGNALGKTPADQSPLYAPRIYIDHLRQAIETATESTAEIPFRTAKGEMHWGHMRFVPEFGPDGKVVSVLAIGNDIHEIKENENRFRMLAENFPDYVVRFDRDGHYTYVNSAVENAFGMSTEAIVGKTLQELPQRRTSEQNDALLALIRRVFDEGVANESEVCWDTEMGERIFEIRHAPEKDAAGNVVSVLSFARDITDRKRAEQERLAHLRFFECMDHVNRAIQGTNDLERMMSDVLDVVISVFDCDRAFLMYPCDPGAAAWHAPMERNKPEYPGVLELGREMRMDPDVAETLRILLTADGPVKFGPGTPYALPADVAERFGFKCFMSMAIHPKVGSPWQFGIHQCSYARVWRAEEERLLQEIGRRLGDALTGSLAYRDVRESEKRFRDLYENAPNAYFCIGVDGLIGKCNRRAGELLGYAVEELEGRPVMTLYADTAHGKEKATQVLQRFQAGETVRDEELEMKKADGNPVWISLTVDAVRDAQNRIVQSRSMVVDITERKRVESIMQARLRLLELANSRSMDELLTAALDEIEALTGSTIGFYHFLDPAQRTLSLQSWSTNTLKNMCAAEGKGCHYDVARAGVWVDCIHQRGPVIHNDYASLPHRKGMPEGHARVIREVVVPILRGNLIKAIVGVGNKSTDYAENDVEIVKQLGDLSWDIVERMRAEEALKQAEEKYRGIFENTVEGIFQSSPEGRYLSANPALARMLGYDSPQDLIAGVADIRRQLYVNPEDRKKFQKSLEEHGFVTGFEIEEYRKDGRIIWVSINARAVGDPEGRIRYYEGTIEDITDRKSAEEALRESEDRYRTIFRNSPLGIFRTTVNGRFLEANPAAAKLFGYDSPEMLIREIHDIGKQLFAHPEDRPRIISEQIGSSGVTRRVTRYRRKDGSELIANLYLQTIRSAEGQPLFFEGIVEDITERVRAEEALRRANETLRATLEAAPLAIFDLDTEGRVKSLWNAAAEQMLGWGRDEAIGRFLPSVQEDKKEEFNRFRDWIRSGKRMMGHDVVRRRKDGSLIEYSIYAAPEYDNDGKVAGNIAVLVDITDRKRTEDQIRKLNMELEQRVKDRTARLEAANRELEAFAYSVSHDLRAPLRHIDGFLELLQNRTGTIQDEKSRHYMAVITDSAKKMGRLIDDLLSFSRMGRYEMSKIQVDLGALVKEAIREVAPEAEGRTIRWKIGELPVVAGDRAMLRIVLVNLISNALKFTLPREQADIEIGCQVGEKETVIFIRDNGVGFDMAYVDKLFNVFQRLHHADEFEGTGIGLANVRRIISRHGGRTWAEGENNQGAAFYFSLPRSIQGA